MKLCFSLLTEVDIRSEHLVSYFLHPLIVVYDAQ